MGEILAGQRIQVYTPETVDTLTKESIAAYSGSERRRMLRRMVALLAALALLAAILIPVLVRRMTPEPVSGFEQTYYEYSLLCDFDGADIGQLFAQYLLNGEQRHVFATFLVRWEDGTIAAVDKIGCELPEDKPGDNSFQVQPCLWDVGEDSFQILLKMTVKEADKKLESRRDELYTVRFDEYGIPTMEFDRYLY